MRSSKPRLDRPARKPASLIAVLLVAALLLAGCSIETSGERTEEPAAPDGTEPAPNQTVEDGNDSKDADETPGEPADETGTAPVVEIDRDIDYFSEEGRAQQRQAIVAFYDSLAEGGVDAVLPLMSSEFYEVVNVDENSYQLGGQGEETDWQPLVEWVRGHPLPNRIQVEFVQNESPEGLPSLSIAELAIEGGYFYLAFTDTYEIVKIYASSERIDWNI